MQLNKNNLDLLEETAAAANLRQQYFELPEKVLQFGTGVLLRALPDYFIDKANKQGIFKGRVVIVKSTESDSTAFDTQDGLYTVCVRGIANEVIVEKDIINASVSRVLSAKKQWKEILACAHNAAMQVVISNTTEVGIQYVKENIDANPPVSFPGKLLSFLVERYKAFNGSADSGMVIVPTELISDNGLLLKKIILQLASDNALEEKCIDWIKNYNYFCNSLVDRIVPGKPNASELIKLESRLGYADALLTMSEVFCLWAIEGNHRVKEVLSFCKADENVIIVPDITRFKELKLRLLNGTHTFNCGTAFLAGFDLTREANTDEAYSKFTLALMQKEIAPSIPFDIEDELKQSFAKKVFERFCNPYIDHQWLSIAVQCSSKMRMRNVPLLLQYYQLYNDVPQYMAAGFAAYILFMKAIRFDGKNYYGNRNATEYLIQDEAAAYYFELWQHQEISAIVHAVLTNTKLWDINLAALPGFENQVLLYLEKFMQQGVKQTIDTMVEEKVLA